MLVFEVSISLRLSDAEISNEKLFEIICLFSLFISIFIFFDFLFILYSTLPIFSSFRVFITIFFTSQLFLLLLIYWCFSIILNFLIVQISQIFTDLSKLSLFLLFTLQLVSIGSTLFYLIRFISTNEVIFILRQLRHILIFIAIIQVLFFSG